jgi:hypothetical protein
MFLDDFWLMKRSRQGVSFPQPPQFSTGWITDSLAHSLGPSYDQMALLTGQADI